LKEFDDDKFGFVLIKIPFEKCLEIAEKIRLKMPIQENDLNDDESIHNIWQFWTRFESLKPNEIRRNKKREFFTAQFNSSIRDK
jgi:hypothetical protein